MTGKLLLQLVTGLTTKCLDYLFVSVFQGSLLVITLFHTVSGNDRLVFFEAFMIFLFLVSWKNKTMSASCPQQKFHSSSWSSSLFLSTSGSFSIDDIRIPRRPWDEILYSMIPRLKRGTFWQKNTNKHRLVAAESLQNDRNRQKTAIFKSWNLKGKLKGYLFQKTKLWKELVVLTAKLKKPRSQKKKQEVIKKMVYCVKMSILESFS